MVNELNISYLISEIGNLSDEKNFSGAIDGRYVNVCCSPYSLAISFFINDSWDINDDSLHYISLFIGGHPDMYDYALHITTEGLWLCRCYAKNMTTELLTIEVEKHIIVTQFVENIVNHRAINYSEKACYGN